MESAKCVARLAATALGMLAIGFGIYFVVRVFVTVYGHLSNPAGFKPLLDEWVKTLGGAGLDFHFDGKDYSTGAVVAALLLGVGAILLGWLALGLTLTGAKIVSWTVSDREAVKRVLRRAFGTEKPVSPEK
jgi:hypothetical protein